MKTFKQFLDEASLAADITSSAIRQYSRNKRLAKAAQSSTRPIVGSTPNAPQQIQTRTTHHGTTKAVSDAINRSGYRTDANVTRQMSGAGVYSAAVPSVARNYAQDRAVTRNDTPATRTFQVPKPVYQKQTQIVRGGAGDPTGKGYRMTTLSPQQANKYDVTKSNTSRVKMHPKHAMKVRQRINARVRAGGGGMFNTVPTISTPSNPGRYPTTVGGVLRQTSGPISPGDMLRRGGV